MRLIDADALIAEWCDGCKYLSNGICDQDVCGGVLLMKEAPTIDPESLRGQAEWELKAQREATNDRWNVTAKCTGCGNERGEIWAGFFPGFPDNLAESISLDNAKHVQLSNYCPNCGARMKKDGDADD